MKLTLASACNAFAAMQAGVIQTQGRLRIARHAVLASSDIVKAGATPLTDRATLDRYGRALTEAECALTEYRDAGPQFAFVLSKFAAANDDIGNDLPATRETSEIAVFPMKPRK